MLLYPTVIMPCVCPSARARGILRGSPRGCCHPNHGLKYLLKILNTVSQCHEIYRLVTFYRIVHCSDDDDDCTHRVIILLERACLHNRIGRN